MNTSYTCVTPDRLRQLLSKPADAPERRELDAHLRTCEKCRETLLSATAEAMGFASSAQAESAVIDQTAINPSEMPTIDAKPSVLSDNPTRELEFLSPARDPQNLGRLAHYELRQVVGRGGMGTVFRAHDESLHREVAVKLMSPELAAVDTARQRFIREARAAAQVTHENVVTIHSVHDDQPVPFLVMQLVEGQSLQERIAEGTLTVDEIIRIGREMASGLAAAHAKGLIHRDIKPANILLEQPTGRVKLTDFGLARAVDDASVSQSGTIIGTPLYMSPEQARGQSLDHRADLFSLGAVLYALCTGRSPFHAGNMMAVMKRVCDDTPAPIAPANPEVPPWLEKIILKLLAKNPNQRCESAAEVDELLSAGADATVRVEPVANRRRWHKSWLIGIAALVVVSAIAILDASKKRNGDSAKPSDPSPAPAAQNGANTKEGNTTINLNFPGFDGLIPKQVTMPNPEAMPNPGVLPNPADFFPKGFGIFGQNGNFNPGELMPKMPVPVGKDDGKKK